MSRTLYFQNLVLKKSELKKMKLFIPPYSTFDNTRIINRALTNINVIDEFVLLNRGFNKSQFLVVYSRL